MLLVNITLCSEVYCQKVLNLIFFSTKFRCGGPLSTASGTNKAVNAIFWPWFEPFVRQKSSNHFKLFLLCSASVIKWVSCEISAASPLPRGGRGGGASQRESSDLSLSFSLSLSHSFSIYLSHTHPTHETGRQVQCGKRRGTALQIGRSRRGSAGASRPRAKRSTSIIHNLFIYPHLSSIIY